MGMGKCRRFGPMTRGPYIMIHQSTTTVTTTAISTTAGRTVSTTFLPSRMVDRTTTGTRTDRRRKTIIGHGRLPGTRR